MNDEKVNIPSQKSLEFSAPFSAISSRNGWKAGDKIQRLSTRKHLGKYRTPSFLAGLLTQGSLCNPRSKMFGGKRPNMTDFPTKS
jgi:hypothetical protein